MKKEQGQWPSVSKMGNPSFLWTRSLKNLRSQFISGYLLTNQRPFPLRELQLYLIIFLRSILQVSAHWRRRAETCRYNCCTVTAVSRPALYSICTAQKNFTTLDNIPLWLEGVVVSYLNSNGPKYTSALLALFKIKEVVHLPLIWYKNIFKYL